MGPLVICALLVFLGWRAPRYRSLAIGATGVLIFLASTLAWRFLVHSEASPWTGCSVGTGSSPPAAPMAGVTNAPFRLVARECGACDVRAGVLCQVLRAPLQGCRCPRHATHRS